MTDSWLKNYSERAKELHVDIGNKDEALKFLRDVRRSEKQQQTRPPLTRSSAVPNFSGVGRNGGQPLPRREVKGRPLPPARADTIGGLRRMFKAEGIFKHASEEHLSEFLVFLKEKGGNVHAAKPVLRLYSLFRDQKSQTGRHFLDNPKTRMTQKLIRATNDYLSPPNALVDAAAQYAEALRTIFHLNPIGYRQYEPVQRNALTELIRQTPEGKQEAVKDHVVHLCTSVSHDALNELDEFGETPLTTALHHNALDLVDLLIDLGADVNCANARGDTPLAVALAKCPHLAQPLLDKGADVFCVNQSGETPLEAWRQAGSDPEIGHVLFEVIANTCDQAIWAFNAQGGSLRHAQAGFTSVVQSLESIAENESESGKAAAECLNTVRTVAEGILSPLDILLTFINSPDDAYLDFAIDSVPAFVRSTIKKLDNAQQIITTLEQIVTRLDAHFQANNFSEEKNPANALTKVLCTLWDIEHHQHGFKFLVMRRDYSGTDIDYDLLAGHWANQLMRHPELIDANKKQVARLFRGFLNDSVKDKLSFNVLRNSPETALCCEPLMKHVISDQKGGKSLLSLYIQDTLNELSEFRCDKNIPHAHKLLLHLFSIISCGAGSWGWVADEVRDLYELLVRKLHHYHQKGERKALLKMASAEQRAVFDHIEERARQVGSE